MKPCPFCAEQIQDQAIKCRFCGSMLDGTAPAGQPAPRPQAALAQPQAALAQPQATPIPAQLLFEGSPSWKAWFWTYALMALVALAAAFGGWASLLGFVPWRWGLGGVGVIVLADLLWLGAVQLLRRSTRYRLTSRNLDTERGVLSKQIETLQLWRVRDLDFRQSLIERLLGIARIHVFTHDVTDPDLVLRGLPGSRDLFDKLKDAAELSRQQRVVGIVE